MASTISPNLNAFRLIAAHRRSNFIKPKSSLFSDTVVDQLLNLNTSYHLVLLVQILPPICKLFPDS